MKTERDITREWENIRKSISFINMLAYVRCISKTESSKYMIYNKEIFTILRFYIFIKKELLLILF